MISVITNEEELENVVGGIKARHVVGTIVGIVGLAALVVGGKFVYDVYQEYSDKNLNHGLWNAGKSWGSDLLNAGNVTYKSPWRRAVSSTANYIFDYTHNKK